MAVTAPEHVSAPAADHAAYWTRIRPTDLDRPVNWSDHRAAHHAVMSLFSRHLPGREGERRAANGILYRVDAIEDEPIMLVQSLIEPTRLPPGARSQAVPEHLWRMREGTDIQFRVTINPITRNGSGLVRDENGNPVVKRVRQNPDGTSKTIYRKKETVARTLTLAEAEEALHDRLHGVLADVNVLRHARHSTRSGKQTLVVDSIDATATVVDTDGFTHLRRAGIGRSKSYGCGLLTALPIH